MEFFSSNRYIFLPTKNNPKVSLCVDNSKLIENAFKLYNPFSPKAKLFKGVSEFSFIVLNDFMKFFGTKKESSEFILYLEKLLKQPIISSIYYATANDKVVLQLQSSDAKIIGYLKYPLNDMGKKHIENEIKAIDILSKKGVIDKYILSDIYDEKPFILLKDLDGEIDRVQRDDLKMILKLFEKKNSFTLEKHPRVSELKAELIKNGIISYVSILESICINSEKRYKVVYEHGDFTPWNIVKVEDRYIPFDFEYFVEDGLEHFDMIKYYYQIGKLLEGRVDTELYNFVKENVKLEYFKDLFTLFLIKEILRQKVEGEDSTFEEDMIAILEIL